MNNRIAAAAVIVIVAALTLLFVKNTIDSQNAPVKDDTQSTVRTVKPDKKSDKPDEKAQNGTQTGNETKKDDNTDSNDENKPKPDVKTDTKSDEKAESKTDKKSDKNTDKNTDKNDAKNDKKKSDSSKPAAVANYPLAVSALGEVSQKVQTMRVSFVACGDNIVHSTVLADAKDLAAGTDKEYNFIPMFSNVADIIKDADIAYINQESPFGGPEKGYSGYPMFNSPDQVGYDLMELGFDIVNLANNHMLDSGTSGYERTVEFWKKQPITYIGGYTDKDDYNNIRVIEKDGISIALLSYTYGTNGIPLASSSKMVIPLCDESGTKDIDRMTKEARKLADIVMVSIHWGNEDWFKPSDLQKKQMQIMVDNGVDVIIGTHPHVLEPMEWHERPDGGRTLVIYSLGNFLSGMLYMRNMVGGIAGFDLVKAGDAAFVDAPYFIPTVCQYNTSWRKFKIYKFSDYTEDLLSAHRCQRISDPGNTMSGLRRIIDNAIPNEFLIEDFYRTDKE